MQSKEQMRYFKKTSGVGREYRKDLLAHACEIGFKENLKEN